MNVDVGRKPFLGKADGPSNLADGLSKANAQWNHSSTSLPLRSPDSHSVLTGSVYHGGLYNSILSI